MDEGLKKEKPMPQKVYVKPPAPTRTMLKAQMVVVSLFLPLGPVFVFVAEGETRPTGLSSDGEYQKKREQILQDQW